MLLVTRLVCMHSFLVDTPLKKQGFFIFWKGKRVNLPVNKESVSDCPGGSPK